MAGRAGRFDVVLDQHTVVDNRNVSGTRQFPCRIETWAVPDDVVGLPFAGGARSIHQWRILAVYGAGLSVRVGFAVLGIEHLNLVLAH